MFIQQLILMFFIPIKNIIINIQLNNDIKKNYFDYENECNLTDNEIQTLENIQLNLNKKNVLIQLENSNISILTKLNLIHTMNKYNSTEIPNLHNGGLYDDYLINF